MSRWTSRRLRIRRRAQSRNHVRAVAVATVLVLFTGLFAPAADASPALVGGQIPSAKMYGYAAGPKQHVGSAAGLAHYVPASATRAKAGTGTIKGHPAPVPELAPQAVGTTVPVTAGAVRMPSGHEVAHHEVAANPSAPGSSGTGTSTTPGPSGTPVPATSPTSVTSPVPSQTSELELFGITQGWTASQTPSGPLKFIDQNGITRMTLKNGSPRAPGSGSPHAEFRDPTGQRIDPFGNQVQRRSPDNHTPIEWDC